jgi:hypothetical protein
MMRLSTMWKVDSTVDTAGSSRLAERILEGWQYEAGSVRFFRSSANFLYTFQSDDKRYFLRFAASSERSRAAIEAEVDLVNWLGTAGIAIDAGYPFSRWRICDYHGDGAGFIPRSCLRRTARATI